MDLGNTGSIRTPNGRSWPEDDGSGSDRDSSSSVVSMSSIEIESHFTERYSRRFHSLDNGGVGQYPLPVDEAEGQRLDRAHELVKDLLGRCNYRGPVEQTLVTHAVGGRRIRVLDICTGNGKWVEEVAEEFSHAKVYGIDMAPLATRYPADNVQFEVHDINTTTRWAQGRFDFVHMRQVCLSAIDYASILHEVARILRPGGLFLACEWMLGIYEEDSSGILQISSHARDFFGRLHEFSAHRNLFHDPPLIPRTLAESAFYADMVSERHIVPLDHTPQGLNARQFLLDFADAVQCFFLDSGLSASQIADILRTLRQDLEDADDSCLVYLTVHARRTVAIVSG